MEVFFPVSEEERDALLARDFRHAELSGLERIAWDTPGVHDDAIWIAAEVDDDVATRHEDSDGDYLGYRPFTFPRELLNGFSWRVVGADEVMTARQAEADAADEFRKQQRDG
jgi:hypothetical protein